MPGFTIHIAIAKQYLNKHKHEIRNEHEFIKGSIAPDLDESMTQISKNKTRTHYGKYDDSSIKTDISSFLKDINVNITSDYWKGYLLHLLSDFYFYKEFENECLASTKNNDTFYYDYDCLNAELIEKYKIKILPNIKQHMNTINGKLKYLDKNKVFNFIERISILDLDNQIKLVSENGMSALNKFKILS